MGDKSSWDTFRKWHFWILKHLLYFTCSYSVALTLCYPPPPNSMLYRCCDLWCLWNRKINIVLWGRGANVTKMLKNRILLPSVATLLSPIVHSRKLVFAKVTGVALYWNVCHRFILRFGSLSWENYGKLTHQYKNLRKIPPFWKCNHAWHSCVTLPI